MQMNADGTFGSVSSFNLGGMATASPVVYKGRIYVGVCGNGGQFNSDGGHHFAVLNETASGISLAYNVSIPGYPQAAPLLSTAYENQDFNGDGPVSYTHLDVYKRQPLKERGKKPLTSREKASGAVVFTPPYTPGAPMISLA